ncbi:Kinesin motor domain containing protein [Trichomonas vaginalis G3]|uniref:Kinesin motor domain containing protein n=1 Tax=Trichomonas vaginalis (strain ATCC PRA-98 / G3) TaxID=412133 RepID=A2F4F3_TRIV3|nr:microtubule motor protein [Trichomonas vaginalis G3]EAY00218.1 Kinesin motor domain containing protein [Trichomonas vaginalis G3]KAI5492892.1 microtubule motor protein [Trichomonas vaginalis G3]|eukprot:XP_001313147.1 Kinesin motor domain containing protein [Trichomonas vaginalis G3]
MNRKVHIRVRPTEEIATDYIKLGEDGQSVTVKSLKVHPRSFLKHQISSYTFHFQSILLNTDQQAMFNLTTRPALDAALNGTPSCIICCGGVKSGKTYTLDGPDNDYANRGLVPRAIQYLFSKLAAAPELEVKVRCSYIEFLNEQLFDILNAFNGQPAKELKITELNDESIAVKNLLTPLIKDEQGGLECLFKGNAYRNLNPEHLKTTSVFTLWLDSDVPQPNTEKPLHSKISFVDMATALKIGDMNRDSDEFHRQANINRTMTVLERVLIADDHIPYRSCPLTHFLKDSLPNRCLIACCSFDRDNLAPTLATLKFSSCVQGETSDDILNLKEHKDSQINRLQKEIDDMRAQLRVKNPQMSFCEPDRQERQIIAETVNSFLSDAVQSFPIRSLYEIRAALSIMKDQFRSQKVAAEEQLREKYVFTVKPPEPTKVVERQVEENPMAPDEYISFFPLLPTEKELWQIYRSTAGEAVNNEIMERQDMIAENKKKVRDIAIIVNQHKAQIDALKAQLEEKQKNRLPPIDGVLVIDEEELKIREELTTVKKNYKEAFAKYQELKEKEKTMTDEITDMESQMESGFKQWMEERDVKQTAKSEEEEENEELLDKEERRERREYQKIVENEPKAAPYFFAQKKIQKILEREFRRNGTRKQPVEEEQ